MPTSSSRTAHTPVEHLLTLGPWLVVGAWILAGHWSSGDPDSLSWVVLAGIVGAAWLLPLPTRSARRAPGYGIRWWGWALVAGLLATS